MNGLGLFTNQQTVIEESDSLVVKLLKTPALDWKNITTRIPYFDENTKKASNVAFKIFAQGPEHDTSIYATKLKNMIENAENEIVIDHMYFHPTTEIMNALINAANRGVKIKIITAGIYANCPLSHYAFGPRNKYNYAYLINSVSEEMKDNIEVFEFQQIKKGNHKKVIVIDDQVIAGSSNCGYKSLVTCSDHELNFFAKSREFADETLKVCEEDIRHSVKVQNPTELKIKDYFQATIHRIMAPLVG